MPDGRPCLYDDAARVAFGGDPPVIADVRGPKSAQELALLDRAGEVLAASTAAMMAAVRAVEPAAQTLLLAYLPTVLDPAAPEMKRANLPLGWASPAFDFLQLEDYDWAATGATGLTARGIAAAEARLGYPPERQHYFAGFVLRPDQRDQWRAIDAAADAARGRGVAATFVWALPQVMRDGYIHFDEGEGAVEAFDDVRFPLAMGREAEVSPETSTAIHMGAGGHERRNVDWAGARTRYDVGPGIRSEGDIRALLAFFRARQGAARAFRLEDPFDSTSNDGAVPTPFDQRIGAGDGIATGFALVKRYGAVARRITRPVAGSVRVAIDGAETADFTLGTLGMVQLDAPPAAGAVVTAGYRFDVPVRFAEDRLDVARATHLAGAAPSVPLIEVREA